MRSEGQETLASAGPLPKRPTKAELDAAQNAEEGRTSSPHSVEIILTNASRENLIDVIALLGMSIKLQKVELAELHERLALKNQYIERRAAATSNIDSYDKRSPEELVATCKQLHKDLTEAEATIVAASDSCDTDSPVWGILDDYDGSMDNVKALTTPLVETIEGLKAELSAQRELERNRPNYQMIVVDLCRCVHGRIQGDTCNSCAGGVSPSREGIALGYSLSAQQRIVIPSRDNMHTVKEWYK